LVLIRFLIQTIFNPENLVNPDSDQIVQRIEYNEFEKQTNESSQKRVKVIRCLLFKFVVLFGLNQN